MAWKLPPDQNAMGGVFGAQDAAPYQQGDFQRSGPQMRPVGVGESVANALLPQRDEQGIPKPMGVADILNAALWVVPGMRGMKRPSPVSPQQPALGGDALLTALRRDVIDRGSSGRPTETFNLANTEPQSIATSRKAQFEATKSRWDKSGPELDFPDVWETAAGDRAWAKEVQAWNKEHGTNFNPDNMPQNSSTQGIFDRFSEKYLAGKKQKFPGASQANEHFENSGDLGNMVHLKRNIPEEYGGSQKLPRGQASLVSEYGQRLKQALGNKEAWGPLMQELQADARLSHPDLVQISSDFYGGIPKGSSRIKAIENIQKRHNKLVSWKDELDSGVLK